MKRRLDGRAVLRIGAVWVLTGLGGVGPAAAACELALVLAVDVSGSVDPGEYRLQMAGLAAGLRDAVVAEALVKAQARLSLVQWTGESRQQVTLPWRQIRGFDDVEAFARQVASAPRGWRHFSTAIGEALEFSRRHMAQVADCERLVIDVSGDGVSNEGVAPANVLPGLRAAGITVNALVIEGAEDDLTGYYWENVITGEGSFVVTANDFRQYADKMRIKLRRETTIQLSLLR
jgi:Ca-activated chloride channel homolog